MPLTSSRIRLEMLLDSVKIEAGLRFWPSPSRAASGAVVRPGLNSRITVP